jgi:pyridoxamine 5'-phosphate oxidase
MERSIDPDLAALREEYRRGELDERVIGEDPIAVVRRWVADAVASELDEPNAMTLATVGLDGRPSARTVLLKGLDERGFEFFTSYESRKGQELAADPACALVLTWAALARQVRVSGRAERVTAEETAAYFAVRPRGSQLGAWASRQSEEIPDREVLERRLAELQVTYAGVTEIPVPPYWGGYRVVPDEVELWHGRPNRLHDRLRYTRTGAGWERVRLSP